MKDAINNIIFEKAYEIESKLREDNGFYASMSCVPNSEIAEVSLQCAIIWFKKEMGIPTSKRIHTESSG